MGLNQGPHPDDIRHLIHLAYEAGVVEEYLDEITAVATDEQYQRLLYKLEDLQPSIDQIKNPNQKDISEHLNRFI